MAFEFVFVLILVFLFVYYEVVFFAKAGLISFALVFGESTRCLNTFG